MKKKLFLFLPLVALISSCSYVASDPSASSTPSETSTSTGTPTSSETPTSTGGATSSETPTSSGSEALTKTKLRYTMDDFADGSIYNTPNCPVVGSPKVLIIPIWFTDSDEYLRNETYKSNVISDIGTVFMGEKGETGWHSVISYFKEESDGKLDLQGRYWDTWYECGYSSADVAADSTFAVLNDILINATDDYFKAFPNEDRKDYDYDKDGYIDAVSLIYASPTYDEIGYSDYNNLWAFCFWRQGQDANVDNPVTNTYFWASMDFMYSRLTCLERTGNSEYYYGSVNGLDVDNPLDSHTYIHEFGHVLGLDDYYDYNGLCSPVGGFTMQDTNTGGHDPYSVMSLGWADPYIPTESCSIEIRPFQSSKDLILLTPEWNGYDSPFDEYILIDLYTPTGLNEHDVKYPYGGPDSPYPKGSSKTGIRVWHIDARLATYDRNEKLNSINELATCPIYSDTDREIYYVYYAFRNTYYSEGGVYNSYGTPFGEEYSNYNQVHLIRNSLDITYRPDDGFDDADLYEDGDIFTMDTYSKQFVNGTKFNNGSSFPWSFSIELEGEGEEAVATINCFKS